MITQLDGTKLPSHSELYSKPMWMKRIVTHLILGCGFGEKFVTHSTQFEKNDWDFIFNIVIEQSEGGQVWERNVFFFCEYKSNLKEWGRGIEEFLRQINKRHVLSTGQKLLLTFDDAFSDYKDVLSSNNVRLFVLPQLLLDAEKNV